MVSRKRLNVAFISTLPVLCFSWFVSCANVRALFVFRLNRVWLTIAKSSVCFRCAILGLLRNPNAEASGPCYAHLKQLQCREMLTAYRTLCLLMFCVRIIGYFFLTMTCILLNLTYWTLYVLIVSVMHVSDPVTYGILTKYTGCIFCDIPEHFNCHGVSRRMPALYTMKLPCSGTR